MPKKFLLTFFMSFTLLFSIVYAKNNVKILVNDSELKTDVNAFILNDKTYVPIRFVSEALDADKVTWDENSKSVTIKQDDTTLMLLVNKNYGYINNKYTTFSGAPIIKDNRTFVPLRLVSETLGADVNWDANTYTVAINTEKNDTSSDIIASTKPSSGSSNSSSSSKPSSGSSNSTSSNNSSSSSYTNDDVYWLARIIEAEASGEPYKGKVAVGEVILNRVKSDQFPNTIWGVIFDNTYAIQFEPVANGTIYNTPSEESIKAAKEALNGSNYTSGCLYFLNPQIAVSNWIVKNREFYATIANHDFYL